MRLTYTAASQERNQHVLEASFPLPFFSGCLPLALLIIRQVMDMLTSQLLLLGLQASIGTSFALPNTLSLSQTVSDSASSPNTSSLSLSGFPESYSFASH